MGRLCVIGNDSSGSYWVGLKQHRDWCSCQCTNWQQPVGCAWPLIWWATGQGLHASEMSSQCSPQWDARDSQECVFLLLHTKAVHHNVISLKKKRRGKLWKCTCGRDSQGQSEQTQSPRTRECNSEFPHLSSWKKRKALLSLFSLDYWVSSIQRLCCAFSTYLPTGKSWLF